MQPNIVGQVGGSQCLIALSVHAMAGGACCELGLAQVGPQRVMGAARQAQHVVGQIFHIVCRSHCGGHGRHLPVAAVSKCLGNVGRSTAVQPIGIRQVGKAFGTPGIRTVALRAVVHKQTLTNGFGLWVTRHILGRHRSELGIQRRYFRIALVHFRLVLAYLCPTQLTSGTAQAGVHGQVGQSKHNGDNEKPHPPARQWIVHLPQVTVPHVAGGVVMGRHGPSFATEPQQQSAGQDAQDRDAGNEDGPKPACKVAHIGSLWVLSPARKAGWPLPKNRWSDAWTKPTPQCTERSKN